MRLRSRLALGWLFAVACAPTSPPSEEVTEAAPVPRGVHPLKQPSSQKVLRRPYDAGQGEFPVGTRLRRDRDTGDLVAADLRQPATIAGIRWRRYSTLMLYPGGEVRSGIVFEDAIDPILPGLILASGFVVLREDGSVESMTARAFDFGEACNPCRVSLFPGGEVRTAVPTREMTIEGVRVPADHTVVLREDGSLEAAVLAGDKTAVWFAPDGSIEHSPTYSRLEPPSVPVPLRRGFSGVTILALRLGSGFRLQLDEDAVIDGVPCRAGAEPADIVGLWPDLSLQSCRLAETMELDGAILHRDASVSFDAAGHLVAMTSTFPHTIRGVTCRAGDPIHFGGPGQAPECQGEYRQRLGLL